jgi:hypothetical protein
MTGNRLLFVAIVAVLLMLVVAMVVLSTGTASGPEGLTSLVVLLVGAGIVVAVIEAIRRVARRTR